MEDTQIDHLDRKPLVKSHSCNSETVCDQNAQLNFVPDKEYSQTLQTELLRDFWYYPFNSDPARLSSPFESIDSRWEIMYQHYLGFVQKYGYPHPPSDLEHHALKDWLNRQILNKRHLSDSQFRKLDILGINWNYALSKDHAWELMFIRLMDFSKTFGHCRVPYGWDKDKQLALWVLRQRKMYSIGKIPDYRKRLLNESGFIWQIQDLYNTQWGNYFQQLLSFKNEHGHCNVPGSEPKLASWIERQRLLMKRRLLSVERENRLNEIKIIWEFNDIKSKVWDEKYRQLLAFRKKYGHSFLPVNYKENKQLGNWVATQRKLEANNKLSKARVRRLDKLNFVWSRETQSKLQSEYDSQWDSNYKRLKEYKQLYGSCQVSLKVDPLLQSWTAWQRKMFYEDKMPTHRSAQLNEISFPWNINEGYWLKMFGMLTEFHKKFGHTHVPSQWSENPRLAGWVYRVKLNKGILSTEKIDVLNSLGFEWDLKRKIKEEWIFMFNSLLEFKENYGHTRVPVKWAKNLKLGKWVSRMRNERQVMEQDRLARFEAIEFNWGNK